MKGLAEIAAASLSSSGPHATHKKLKGVETPPTNSANFKRSHQDKIEYRTQQTNTHPDSLSMIGS